MLVRIVLRQRTPDSLAHVRCEEFSTPINSTYGRDQAPAWIVEIIAAQPMFVVYGRYESPPMAGVREMMNELVDRLAAVALLADRRRAARPRRSTAGGRTFG